MRFIRLAHVLLAGIVTGPLSAEIIDFDAIVPGGNGNGDVGPALDQLGYRFSSSHFHTISNFSVIGGLTQNGSPVYIGCEGGALGSTLTMTRIDGAPFQLLSFDLAECVISSASYPSAQTLRVIAGHSGGSQTTYTFPLDGVADGAGGLPDFETVAPSLSNVVHLTFDGLSASGVIGLAFALDNIEVVTSCGTSYGAGCPGSGGFVPDLDVPGCPGENDTFVLTVDEGLGGQTAYLVLGLQQAAVPLQSGCFLNVQPVFPVILTFQLGGTGPGNGNATLAGAMPAGTSGISFTMQCFVTDLGSPLGFSASRGLEYSVP